MQAPEILDVDPKTLHLPSTRFSGADPYKLQRQIARYGSSIQGTPLIQVYRASDGVLLISDGVTRATRVAKLLPGVRVRVEVIGTFPKTCAHHPTVGDKLP